MPKIDLRYLIKPTTTPEQEILLSHFYNVFDSGAAANRNIINVEPLYYEGVIAGTEFLTYAATKLYVCYSLTLNWFSNSLTDNYCVTFDESNNAISRYSNSSGYFDGIAVQFVTNKLNISNIFFSRIAVSIFINMNFNGYRITLQ